MINISLILKYLQIFFENFFDFAKFLRVGSVTLPIANHP